MSGLIETHMQRQRERRGLRAAAEPGGNQKDWLLDAGTMVQIATDVLNERKAPQNLIDQWREEGHRTQLKDSRCRLVNMLGEVIETHQWREIVNLTTDDMLKNIEHSQNNGQWRISDFEIELRNDGAGVKHYFVVVEWTDATNAADIIYENGIPKGTMVAKVQNTISLPPEITAALGNSADQNKSIDRLTDLMERLVSIEANRSDTTPTAPVQEAVEAAPAPKRATKTKLRKRLPKPAADKK